MSDSHVCVEGKKAEKEHMGCFRRQKQEAKGSGKASIK